MDLELDMNRDHVPKLDGYLATWASTSINIYEVF